MIGHAKLLTELKRVVKASPADATSAAAHGSIRRVMRFAYETIHQDLLQESLDVYIKVVRDGRIGIAATDTLDRAGLRRCLEAALEIAQHSPRTKSLPPLPGRFELISTDDYVPQTMDASAKAFHDALGHLFHVCQGVDAQLAGSCTLGDDERAVVTSSGVACYAALTVSGAKLVTMHRKLSGFAGAVERDIRKLDLERLLERSLKQCLHRREPLTVPTGTYEVILEPEAVAELMNWMGAIAFNAKSLQERTSCLAGRIGEQMVARSITLFDDGNDPAGLRMPFDYEGVPKQKVPLFDRGRAAGVVYDSMYGHYYGRPSTGHGQPPNDVEGPYPAHVFLEPGTSTREAMIRSCRRGILVPRFHYVSGLLNTREALMTGLTREGACLIKDGKIVGPIATMRFTQSWLEALRHVRAISRERELIADPAQDVGSAVMPTLHLAKFRFTGQSES